MSTDRLQNYFVSRSLLTQDEWAEYVRIGGETKKNPLNLLVDNGRIPSDEAYSAYAYSRGWKYYNLAKLPRITDDIVEKLDARLARERNVLPIQREGDVLIVATVDPSDLNLVKELQSVAKMGVRLVFSSQNELVKAVGEYYSTAKESAKLGALAEESVKAETPRARLEIVDETSEMGEALDIIIEGALRAGASDIHLEPAEFHLSIRYTVDGKLIAQPFMPKTIAPRLAAIIKSRAKLKGSSLTNQDGVFGYDYNHTRYDLRVAVLPCAWGESITLRMGAEKIRDLSEIGFSEDTEARWREALNQPNGIVLAVGPMGSGKTTLHLAGLGLLMQQNRKIVTLEDPVEMKIPAGVTQVSINPGQGLTWEGAMETTLRSAASVLFLGEINKDKIAHTAISAALTGHLVLSTLHTNDAPGSVVRLREMGIRPSVLTDSLRAVCAQRLPRVLCSCKVPTVPTAQLIKDFRLTAEEIHGVQWFGPAEHGCEQCNGIGYKGRTPIHELMTFPEPVRDLIVEDAPNREVAAAARAAGMRTLRDDGLLKVKAGISSLQEIRSHILID